MLPNFTTSGNSESGFQASESGFTISDLPFSAIEIAAIAGMIGKGKSKTEVVKAMPRYSARKHADYVAIYDTIKASVDSVGTV